MTALRLPYSKLSTEAHHGLLKTKKALETGPLDLATIELINLRVSQINGCAYCTRMHAEQLRTRDTENAKIDSVAGWRVSEHFSDRERAALAWADSLTHVADTAAPDAVYEPLKTYFSDAEISDLTVAVALMNALNRLAVGMRL
ncbi:carboxymuconolactone decarboxylase family protein [Salinisphaera aquimarina]|uniref:Carboxymuconolactone decarboxylase family protein n=1 Tax=Salinisphaera aquimarina TaxID=2094031 RepID=A0ABV7EKA8_9GAMM